MVGLVNDVMRGKVVDVKNKIIISIEDIQLCYELKNNTLFTHVNLSYLHVSF